MKLKKAMKLYPITTIPEKTVGNVREEYRFDGKEIFVSCLTEKWTGTKGGFLHKEFATESKAVAWLIKGAERKPVGVSAHMFYAIPVCPHCGKSLLAPSVNEK